MVFIILSLILYLCIFIYIIIFKSYIHHYYFYISFIPYAYHIRTIYAHISVLKHTLRAPLSTLNQVLYRKFRVEVEFNTPRAACTMYIPHVYHLHTIYNTNYTQASFIKHTFRAPLSTLNQVLYRKFRVEFEFDIPIAVGASF